jgi:hypothetical protein
LEIPRSKMKSGSASLHHCDPAFLFSRPATVNGSVQRALSRCVVGLPGDRGDRCGQSAYAFRAIAPPSRREQREAGNEVVTAKQAWSAAHKERVARAAEERG